MVVGGPDGVAGGGYRGRALFVLLCGLRAAERTCLLGASANQQLAGPTEEKRGRRERLSLRGGDKQRPKTPGRHLLSFQRRVKHDMGDVKGWRATKTIITSNTFSCQDKK